jgi:PAS domain S-box-containing protein
MNTLDRRIKLVVLVTVVLSLVLLFQLFYVVPRIPQKEMAHAYQANIALFGTALLFMLVFINRITKEYKRAEKTLREGEAHYHGIFDSAMDSFLIFDLDGTIVEANPQACNMYGYSYDELIMHSGRDIVHPDYYHLFEQFKRDVKTKGEFHAESVDVRKDGTTFTVEVRGTTFDYRGKPHLLAVIRDVTRRKQAEEKLTRYREHLEELVETRTEELKKANEQLQQDIAARTRAEEALKLAKEAAEAAAKVKSEFLANMSHEIRTPLNAILGFTELLQRKITDEQHRAFLSTIASSGNSLLRLINDILDLSKIEAGKLELHYEAVNLHAVFNEIKQIFYWQVRDKGLEFHLDSDPDLPESLLLDEIRLRQILLNLVGNAVKFTERGYIRLSVHTKYTKEDHSWLDLIFSVQDTGIGIPEEQRERIFDAFKQRTGQDAAKYGGTGLGLAITKRLVEMMGGEISVESASGRGCTFFIRLKDVAVVKQTEGSGELMRSLPHEEPVSARLDVRDDTIKDEKGVSAQLLTPEVKAELPHLLHILEKECGDNWSTIQKSFIITDIETFAKRIKALGTKYNVAALTNWGDDLFKQANSFDIDRLPKTLNYFPVLIAEIAGCIEDE